MRRIVVLTFISLDGVMQAPGAPNEDTSGNFEHGGWIVPYFDDFLGKVMKEQMTTGFDLLLGRKTFEIWAAHWPRHREEDLGINQATKYVVSTTLTKHEWEKSVFLDGVEAVRRLKGQDGPDLQVHGSSNLVQSLMKHDLVDEFWLKTFLLTIGKGKRLFGDGTKPASYAVVESRTSPAGVVVSKLRPAGALKTGSF